MVLSARCPPAQVDLLPVVHGSALFGRGETQSLCTATVGGEGDTQVEDDVMGMATRSLFVHYTFPSFAVNETRKAGGLSRRELGHGRLAERALRPVMPDIDQFPFPVRLTAETLSSNGSSSMAAVCAGSLALKNAGVPIKSLVAGVSIGLITDAQIDYAQQESGGAFHSESRESPGRVGRHVLLTDIQGLEDHLGCMDFKIAGTAAGITATQLDTKFPGVPVGIVTEALQPSLKARRQILEAMGGCLQRGRRQRKPKFGTVEVDKDLAGILIGPRGRTIQGMQAATGARLILRSEAKEMAIYAPTEQQYDRAETAILDVQGANIREGDVYDVKVVTLTDFGAFVELPNGFQALLHISELSHSRIRAVEDVVHEGQEFKVQCLGRDHKGNVKLSRKALLPKPQGWS
ncbi:unnamed protein product [Ostreobium quekettii]|uniref:polyribonucleotide nucleotidyltransferase n=1 Tax=Ostreobium quekettii TaxID=121088 RepID=A0A8S1IUK4_9CHLO|nr:unnamed protein product [Ostreobium quekettii]